jgi:hypothetical protein
LKNKSVALFRESIKQFVKKEALKAGSTESNWILQAANYDRVKKMIDGDLMSSVAGWKQLMEKMDVAIDYYVGLYPEFAKYQASKTADEHVPFNTASDVLEAYQKQELAR